MKLNFKFFLVFILFGFVIYKSILLLNYEFCDGKVIGFETVNHRFKNFYAEDGYERRTLSIIEYIHKNKTNVFTNGNSLVFNTDSVNQKLSILVNKNNDNEVKIFSVFHYWINIQEFILLGLILTIIYGYFRVYG